MEGSADRRRLPGRSLYLGRREAPRVSPASRRGCFGDASAHLLSGLRERMGQSCPYGREAGHGEEDKTTELSAKFEDKGQAGYFLICWLIVGPRSRGNSAPLVRVRRQLALPPRPGNVLNTRHNMLSFSV